MLTEDLAALDILTEDVILDELHGRLQQGEYHTFIGDVLLILNPNEQHDIYDVHVNFMLFYKATLVLNIALNQQNDYKKVLR